MANLLTASPWIGIAAIVLVYGLDYYQTLRGARLYQAGANQVIVIEGSYELNPLFTKEIDRLQRVSPRFIVLLLIYCAFVGAVWVISAVFLDFPQIYLFTLGAVLLLQGPVQLRHARNIQMFKRIRKGEGVSGRIEYTRRFLYLSSATEFFAFSGQYLVLGLLTSSWLLAGGALGCAVLGLRMYRESR